VILGGCFLVGLEEDDDEVAPAMSYTWGATGGGGCFLDLLPEDDDDEAAAAAAP